MYTRLTPQFTRESNKNVSSFSFDNFAIMNANKRSHNILQQHPSKDKKINNNK